MNAITRLGLTAMLLLAAGCGAPRDPDGSTDRIRASRVLRAGATENPPWIRFQGAAVGGRDAEMVQRFAAGLGARVQWSRGSKSVLLSRLEDRKLDLVAGGFTTNSPWADRLGASQTYSGKHVIFSAPGENHLLLELDRFVAARERHP